MVCDCRAKSAGAAICIWLSLGLSFISLVSDYWVELNNASHGRYAGI